MTGSGALALTAVVLAGAALTVAFVADHAYEADKRRLTPIGWSLLVAACACLIGAAWWEALS